jgi:hypothetical protein
MNYRIVIETKETESGWRDEKKYVVQEKVLVKIKRRWRKPRIEERWIDKLSFDNIGQANRHISGILHPHGEPATLGEITSL